MASGEGGSCTPPAVLAPEPQPQPAVAPRGFAMCFLANAFELLNNSPDAVYAVLGALYFLKII